MMAGMNERPRMGIPLVPDRQSVNRAAVRSLTRAVIASGLTALDKSNRPSEFARRMWGDDRTTELVLRAAVTPATLAGNPAIAQVAASFLDVLVPMSAGADLLNRGVKLDLAGLAQINVPAISIPIADFVGEGAPIPVQIEPTSIAATLVPHKLAVITSLTGEVLRSPNAEALVRQALIESTGPAIDKVLFGTTAAASDRPAGLRAGIAGLTPAGAGEKAQAIVDDLQALALAIAPVAGNGNIVLVASPDAAVALRLRLPQTVEWSVLTSSSLAAKTVIAVAANAIVSAVEGAPQIDASSQAAFVRDTVPQEIVTAAGTVATSVGSMFQTDEVGLRLRWPISWALRASNGLAWMTGVNW
jgi:hypothetical protein